MTHIGTILILLVPAALATGLHIRLMPKKRAPLHLAALVLCYAFAVAYILSCAKLLRGKGAIPLADSFDTVKNFVVYSPVAIVLGAVLPFLVRRTRHIWSHFLMDGDGIPERETRVLVPRGKQDEAKIMPMEEDAIEAARIQRTEASLAAQEAELVVDHMKVTPRRRSGASATMLYNIGTRDTKAAKKDIRQRLMWVFIYVALVLFVIIIVYGIIWSKWGG